MSLTTQTWRYVGVANIAASTSAACLDALYSLGISTTYADATSRTEGAGTAWTWTGNRYQNATVTEALYPQPPTNTLGFRALFAGKSVAATPTMWLDTFTTACVHIGMSKNSGAFNAWDNAAPMTSGQFSGYSKVCLASAVVKVHLYECQEGMKALWETGTGTCYESVAGALVDAESPDVATDAESDGNLYLMHTTNTTAGMSLVQWDGNVSGGFMDHITTASARHTGVFTPGSATMLPVALMFDMRASMTPTGLKTRSGRYARLPMILRYTAAAPNDGICGRLREICYFSDGIFPTKQTSGGTTYGYVVSGSNASACDAFILKH